MNQRVVAVVQMRLGSTRFPRKMLSRLAGRPLVEWVLRRLQGARTLDMIVAALPTNPRDDPLAREVEDLGVTVHRGPEFDVLARVVAAAAVGRAEVVVRVCGDNPFVDGGEVDRLVTYFRGHNLDYAFNHTPRDGCRYADGLGAEVCWFGTLRQVAAASQDLRDREHVTWSLYQPNSGFRIGFPDPPPELAAPEVRLDVDRPEDLERLGRLVSDVLAEAVFEDVIAVPSDLLVHGALTRRS